MTTLDITAHRLAKHQPRPTTDETLYALRTADGFWLHQAIADGHLTMHEDYRWSGNREQMRKALEQVPEGIRTRLCTVTIAAPRAAKRAG